jgi:hypothetical protein
MRTFVIGFLLVTNLAPGQFFEDSQEEYYENTDYGYFHNSTTNEEFHYEMGGPDQGVDDGPGNAGEPIPINQNIPFLLVAGIGLGIYGYRLHKKKSSVCPQKT